MLELFALGTTLLDVANSVYDIYTSKGTLNKEQKEQLEKYNIGIEKILFEMTPFISKIDYYNEYFSDDDHYTNNEKVDDGLKCVDKLFDAYKNNMELYPAEFRSKMLGIYQENLYLEHQLSDPDQGLSEDECETFIDSIINLYNTLKESLNQNLR